MNYELNITDGGRIWTYTINADRIENVNLGMCVILYAYEGDEKKEIAQFSHGYQWVCVNLDEVNKS